MNEQNTRTSYPTDLRDWQQRRRQHLFILPLPLPQRGRGRGLGGKVRAARPTPQYRPCNHRHPVLSRRGATFHWARSSLPPPSPSSPAAWEEKAERHTCHPMFHTPPSSSAAWASKAERHTCHPMFHTPPSSPAARERKGAGGEGEGH
jgi:hypothetical protein